MYHYGIALQFTSHNSFFDDHAFKEGYDVRDVTADGLSVSQARLLPKVLCQEGTPWDKPYLPP
jgi:hypothetical protein